MAPKTYIRNNTRGSALLIAIMIMGILLTLSLGVSELLVGTLRESRALLDRTKAWYAAESGIEESLLAINKNPPGSEVASQKNILEANASSFDYAVHAAAAVIPEKPPYEIKSARDTYDALTLNESVVVPLFAKNAAQNFRVDYYLAPELAVRAGYVNEDIDILRWKIFGIANDGVNAGKMEVMNEFLPMEQGQNSAETPTCFGTQTQCWNTGKFYQYHLSSDGTTDFDIADAYPIREFLAHHQQNFLSLTNNVNVDVAAPSSADLSRKEKEQLAKMYYRVSDLTGGAEKRLTLPTIAISSDGYAGAAKQSLNVAVKRESFLPVFNYSLYRTAP